MIDIFLSASIPLPIRDHGYYKSVDIIAIREAIKSLADVVLPIGRITFGGHPAITPLLALLIKDNGFDRSKLTLFQSRYFENIFPAENDQFVDVRIVEAGSDKASSLERMRHEMISSRKFEVGIFIGGMGGVEIEAEMFGRIWPEALMLPVASTGAAAAAIFQKRKYPNSLKDEFTYHTLFRRQLSNLMD